MSTVTAWLAGLAAIGCVAFAVGLLGCFAYVVGGDIRASMRQRRARPPRPDYTLIAAMEREVYGETFGHDGAPGAVPPKPRRQFGYAVRLAEFDAARRDMQALAARSRAEMPIAAMRSGRARYTVPWAMRADDEGRMWLHPDYGTTSQAQGTSSMRIELRGDGYHVWPPPGESYAPQAEAGYVGTPSRPFLPVAAVSGPATRNLAERKRPVRYVKPVKTPESARCHCHYCRGRAGIHNSEAVALYRAECAAAMNQTTETKGEQS